MSFHTSYMTCLPQELILAVFDKCDDVNDIINFAESNQYVFGIYKANINIVVKQIVNNNKNNEVHNIIWSFYYNKYFNNDHYNNSIDTKLNIVKKINNYLSNIDSFDLHDIVFLDGGDVEKVFELYEEYSLSISNSVSMITDFNETQIEKTKRLIHAENIHPEIAFYLGEKYNDVQTELLIKLCNLLKDNYVLDIIVGVEYSRDETDLNIMIKLAENNFKTEYLVYMTNDLVNNNDYDEYSIMKCIELKNKGISEENIHNLVSMEIHKEFDYEYYESLIKNNHTPDEAIEMIIDEYED